MSLGYPVDGANVYECPISREDEENWLNKCKTIYNKFEKYESENF